MGLGSIPQRIRSLPRLPQIVRVLFKYGFGDVVSRVGIDTALHAVRARVRPDHDERFVQLRTEERIRLALEDLGPTFVKLGQVMATRPDLIPLDLIKELRQLQDKVKPLTDEIRPMVEKELGKPVDTLFKEFSDEPLAAASIAQVHRATLMDGREVVLKIQRPHLDRLIETDMTLLFWLAELAEERLPEVRRYSPVGLVTELHHSLTKEIDFQIEAANVRRFAKQFAGDPDLYVPAVIDELTTSRLLCEEFVKGIPLNHPDIHTRDDVDPVKVAKNGIRLVIQQALVHGFFHGDPHPGNVFVVPENRLCFIDYGMMGVLDQQRIDELLVFLVAILTRDLDKLISLFYRLDLIGEDADDRALRRDVDELIARYESMELDKIDLGRFIQQVFEVVTRHDVSIPSDLLMVTKALATIEGVGRDLYPDLNPLEEVRPYILEIYLKRLTSPGYHVRTPRRIVEDAGRLLESVPADLRWIVRKLRKGELKLQFDLEDYHLATRTQAQAINRLAISLTLSTLVAGSAFLLHSANLTRWIGDFPLDAVLGLAGMITAGLLGLVLFVGYIRSGGA